MREEKGEDYGNDKRITHRGRRTLQSTTRSSPPSLSGFCQATPRVYKVYRASSGLL